MTKYINTEVLENSLDEQLKRIQLILTNDTVKLLCAFLVHSIRLEIENMPTADVMELKELDKITEEHEKIGYEKGYRDGCAQAIEDADERKE